MAVPLSTSLQSTLVNLTRLRLGSTRVTFSHIAMPPKRKVSDIRDDDGTADTEGGSQSQSQSQSQAKRAKQTEDDAKAPNGQPTNKVLPVNIAFPKRAEGTLRFATWNVCGLAAAQRKVRALPLDDRVDSNIEENARFRGSNTTWKRKIRISSC